MSSRHFAGLDSVEREARVPAAVQASDGVADRLAHPLHLVLAALVERQLEPGRAEAAHPGRRGAAVLELDAFGQPAEAASSGSPSTSAS